MNYYKRWLEKESNKRFILRMIDSVVLYFLNKFLKTKNLSKKEVSENDFKMAQQRYEELLNKKRQYEKL